jgi:hypothetical protein
MKTFVLCLLLSLTSALSAATDGMAGVWSGEYHYADKQGKDVRIHFSLISRHDPSSAHFTGHIQEPNVFGNQKDVVLEASIYGIVHDDASVEFVKIYDGHGDQSHSIWYSGKLSDDKKAISGKWYVSDSWNGTFSLSYVDGQ